MLYGLKGNLASLAANLDFGFRQGGHNKTVLACASSFGHFLNEGDEVVETSRWQALHTVDFLGVGHKLVHKDKAGTAGVKETLECLGSGRNTLLVRFLHVVVQLQIPNGQGQLSRHLAPDCVDGDARHVLQLLAVAGIEGCAHQDCRVDSGYAAHAGGIQDRAHSRNLFQLHLAA